MYNDNNRKLRTVLLVLAIVLVLLRIVKVAKAEEITSLEDWFSTRTGDSDFTAQYQQDIQDYPYYVLCDENMLVFSKVEYFGRVGYYGSLRDYPQAVAINYTYYPDWHDSLPQVVWYRQDDNHNNFVRWYSYGFTNDRIENGWAWSSTASYQYTHTQYGTDYSAQPQNSYSIFRGNAAQFVIVQAGRPNYTDDYTLTSVDVQPLIQSSEDDRLKFWTFDNLTGSKTLVTSFDAFCVNSIYVQNEFDNIFLTYELDNIEHTVSLDASNSVIRSTQNQNGGNITYKLETPFSVFGFDDNSVSFRITKCDFTYVKTTMGNVDSTDFKISCNYLAFSRFVPVEPAVIPSPVVSDPTVESSVYTFINSVYSSYSSDRYGRSGTWDVSSTEPSDVSVFRSIDVYHFANEEHGSGVDESIYYYSLLDWGNTSLDLSAYTVFDWDKFLSDNTSALYFDVISVPVYHFTPVGQSSSITGRIFDGYALFYTPSFFLRQQYGLLGDILTVVDQDAQNQYNNGLWLVDKINDFEDKTLDALNANLDIDSDSLSWLKTIDNSIKNLDFPIFDDSSILSGLASIVSALSGNGSDELGVNGRLDKLINFFIANDAQKNDSALAYRNWLDGLDPTETRRVTHFGTNIYSLVKNIFDIFDADYTEDPSFENPDKDYLGIAADYIDALNNRNNTNKFFRGFFDSSFDPLEQSGLPE